MLLNRQFECKRIIKNLSNYLDPEKETNRKKEKGHFV